MKPFILVAAVAAFELAFLASIASPPSPAAEPVSVVQNHEPGQPAMARGSAAPAPVSPGG